MVSIHVPVKDTTIAFSPNTLSTCGFNPRTRKGYDAAKALTDITGAKFQSTYP